MCYWNSYDLPHSTTVGESATMSFEAFELVESTSFELSSIVWCGEFEVYLPSPFVWDSKEGIKDWLSWLSDIGRHCNWFIYLENMWNWQTLKIRFYKHLKIQRFLYDYIVTAAEVTIPHRSFFKSDCPFFCQIWYVLIRWQV